MQQIFERAIPRLVLLGTLAGMLYGVDLPVVADVHVGPSTPQAGALPNLLVGGGNKALLRFDLGLLPAAVRPEQVVKATLVFHVNRIVVAGPLSVAQLYGRFEEMTATASNAPFAAMPIPMTPVVGVNAVDVTPMVQSWVALPASANGIEIAVPSGGSASVQIDSRENTATSFGAEIRVVLAGMVGPTGATGAQGIPGAQGPAGATGATGVVDAELLKVVCTMMATAGMSGNVNCPPKTVFATPVQFTGNLGGLAGADLRCTGDAFAAGVPGTFKAWLSTTQVSASQRMTHWPGPYRRVDGVLLANNWADLNDSSFAAALLTVWGGSTQDAPNVWTGMTAGGGSAANDCSGWTSSLMTVRGNYSTTSGSHGSLGGCGNQMRLVCVEQ